MPLSLTFTKKMTKKMMESKEEQISEPTLEALSVKKKARGISFGVTVFTISLLSVGTLAIKNLDGVQSQRHLFQTQRGLDVCFKRSLQSYTTHLLGNKSSQYLGPNFIQGTHDCYNEINFLVEKDQKISLLLQEDLNQLITSWGFLTQTIERFEALKKPTFAPQQLKNSGRDNRTYREASQAKMAKDLSEQIAEKFRNVESAKDRISKKLDTISNQKITENQNTRPVLGFGLLFLLCSIIYLMLQRKKSKNRKIILENEARELLQYANQITPKTRVVIGKALWDSNYWNTNQLFEQFCQSYDQIKDQAHLNISSQSLSERNHYLNRLDEQQNKSGQQIHLSGLSSHMHHSKTLSPLQESSQNGEVSFDHVIAQVIKRHAKKIFGQKILLDIDTPEDFILQLKEEWPTEIIFHILDYCLKSWSESASDSIEKNLEEARKKYIWIKAKPLADRLILSISLNSGVFSKDWVTTSALDLLDFDVAMDRGLKVSLNLIKDIGGRVSFLNKEVLIQNKKTLVKEVKILFPLKSKQMSRVKSKESYRENNASF